MRLGVVGFVGSVAVLTAACSPFGPSAANDVQLMSCSNGGSKVWKKVSTNKDYTDESVKIIASSLGVSETNIRNGHYGTADCDKPISGSRILAGGMIISVEGKGDRCLVDAAAEDGTIRKADSFFHKVRVVCPSV